MGFAKMLVNLTARRSGAERRAKALSISPEQTQSVEALAQVRVIVAAVRRSFFCRTPAPAKRAVLRSSETR